MMDTLSSTQEVSLKSKKNEILDAYNKALEQAEQLRKESRQQAELINRQKKLIENASKQSSQEAQQSITALRGYVDEKLRDIGESLAGEMQRLKDIQEAVVLEEKALQELYEIRKTAHTLDTLLLSHKEEKTSFDKMMAAARAEWEKEKTQFAQQLQEEQEQAKKAWRREQDEYAYNTQTARQKEADEHAKKQAEQTDKLKQQQAALDEQFAKREALLKESETELSDLREQAAQFPRQLEKAVKQAKEEVTQLLEREHKFKFDLLVSERQAQERLSAQKIEALESKIASQEKLIQQLSDKVNNSFNQVQDIAFKAIEGASRRSYSGDAPKKESMAMQESS
ncbi:MAG: hypothetical protein AAF471_03715 [Myxococcota bacterium]